MVKYTHKSKKQISILMVLNHLPYGYLLFLFTHKYAICANVNGYIFLRSICNFFAFFLQSYSGIAINQNSDKKDKALRFIEYCLSEDVQEYWCGSRSDKGFSGTNEISLPVNNKAFDYAVEVETGEEWDYNEDGEFDEEEKEFSENVDSIFWKDYLGIIDDISGCTLYNYKNLKTTYYNSTVIGDIVDKYLSGDISKEKFIRQLSAATEIYLTE